jgi:hypothetical protein
MDYLIRDIRGALDAGLYALALQGALAVVDICGALGSSNGRSTGDRFKGWFEEHLGDNYDLLDPEDVWLLRCGILHQGRINSSKIDAILFTLPDGRGNVFDNNVIDGALNLDLRTFCRNIAAAAEVWWEANKNTEPVATNAEHIVRVRPDGLAGFIQGVPVLA